MQDQNKNILVRPKETTCSYILHNVCIQPDDLETSPVRAPPTEAPIYETETDDEDLEESSGLDIDRTETKGKIH